MTTEIMSIILMNFYNAEVRKYSTVGPKTILKTIVVCVEIVVSYNYLSRSAVVVCAGIPQ